MSQPAAPWWADVQHLRPTADGEPLPAAPATATSPDTRAHARLRPSTAELRLGPAARRPTGRFARPSTGRFARPARSAPAVPADDSARPASARPAARPATTDLVVDWTDVPAAAPRTRPALPADAGPRERAAAPRRTVQIRGNVEPHREQWERWESSATGPQRRRGRRPAERVGARPDRIALYAVLLGVLLILVAAFSARTAGAAERPTSLGDRTLTTGMVGRDVRHLQVRLRRLGLLRAPATARFGPLTRRAVRTYQRSRCLTADGVAGPATIRALRTARRACRGRGASARGRAAGRRARVRARAAYRAVPLGERTLARGMRGDDVRTLQRLVGVGADGVFGRRTGQAVRALQRAAGLAADGKVGPATRAALAARRMRVRTATWYGPGLYGNRTACGQTMSRTLRGVAHKHLPCGARVVLHHGGRFVVTRVVDRGPFTDGVTFDLTAATARQLGLTATAAIRARY